MIVNAAREAKVAASDAGVVIAPVTSRAGVDVLRATVEAIWGPEVVPPANMLSGMMLGGGGLLLATAGDTAVGFAIGWVGWHGGPHFHSHQVGVRADFRGVGVGLALKLAQRAQCLEHGVTEMRWTFDPLLAANAAFNLVRLGARVVNFLPNYYGTRNDAFNANDITDRVEVSWSLDRAVRGSWVDRSRSIVIAIPPAYHQLRTTDPDVAARWRAEVGKNFGVEFGRGGTVRGLCRVADGVGYVIEPGSLRR